MPVQRCTNNGRRGWKWGQGGTCYGFRKGDAASEKKAKALARKQGLAIQLRSGEFEVAETKTRIRVDEAVLPLLDDESLHDFKCVLRGSLEEFYGDASFWWIESIFGDSVVTEVTLRKPGGMERWTERVPFTRDDAGLIALGDAMRVELQHKTVIVPVAESSARVRNALALLPADHTLGERAALEIQADAILIKHPNLPLERCLESVRCGQSSRRHWSLMGIETPTAAELEMAKSLAR